MIINNQNSHLSTTHIIQANRFSYSTPATRDTLLENSPARYRVEVIAIIRKWYPYTEKSMNLANFGGDWIKYETKSFQ